MLFSQWAHDEQEKISVLGFLSVANAIRQKPNTSLCLLWRWPADSSLPHFSVWIAHPLYPPQSPLAHLLTPSMAINHAGVTPAPLLTFAPGLFHHCRWSTYAHLGQVLSGAERREFPPGQYRINGAWIQWINHSSPVLQIDNSEAVYTAPKRVLNRTEPTVISSTIVPGLVFPPSLFHSSPALSSCFL